MIDTCQTCGGLYATENGEMYGGTPCKCARPTPRTPKPPAVICNEWMDALAQKLERKGSQIASVDAAVSVAGLALLMLAESIQELRAEKEGASIARINDGAQI